MHRVRASELTPGMLIILSTNIPAIIISVENSNLQSLSRKGKYFSVKVFGCFALKPTITLTFHESTGVTVA